MKVLIAILFLINLCFNCFFQEKIQCDNTKKSILKEGVRLDFLVADSNIKIPLIRACINENASVLCAVDTGTSFDVIIKESVAVKMGLSKVTKTKAKINGVFKEVKYGIIEDFKLLGFSNETVMAMGSRNFITLSDKEPIFKSLKNKGKPIDIIVSINSQTMISILQIDYVNSNINIMNHSDDIDYSNAKKMPLKIKGNIPYMVFQCPGGLDYDISIDTGSNSVLISTELVHKYKIKSGVRKLETNFIGFDKSVKGAIIEKIKFGDMEFSDVEVFWQDNPNNLIFGYSLMKDKVVTFDTDKGFVYFE